MAIHGDLVQHWFLTGGSVEKVLVVREDHKSKVLYPYAPLLQVFRGPLVGGRIIFLTLRGPWSKKKLSAAGVQRGKFYFTLS